MMKNILIIFVLVVVVVTFLYFLLDKEESSDKYKNIAIDGNTFNVEIASTSEERVKGLSEREGIESDGLLFIFPNESMHGIWMKDMLFSIDILWINSLGEVVWIEEGVHPETYPEVLYSQEPSLYVLEVDSGVVRENNWHIESEFNFLGDR